MCRSAPPTQQLDASQEDIFREVIPDGSAKALSRYTDMVDALIREQNDRLAGASDDARLRLRERDLPDCLQVDPLMSMLRVSIVQCPKLVKHDWLACLRLNGERAQLPAGDPQGVTLPEAEGERC